MVHRERPLILFSSGTFAACIGFVFGLIVQPSPAYAQPVTTYRVKTTAKVMEEPRSNSKQLAIVKENQIAAGPVQEKRPWYKFAFFVPPFGEGWIHENELQIGRVNVFQPQMLVV